MVRKLKDSKKKTQTLKGVSREAGGKRVNLTFVNLTLEMSEIHKSKDKVN